MSSHPTGSSKGPQSNGSTRHLGPAGRLARAFIDSKLTPLFIIASILLGAFAVVRLPREEEPQIIVPMMDVFVAMPGASAREVEQRITRPLEQLLWEIPGVEYLYSTSQPDLAMVVIRFEVGADEEDATVRVNDKLRANFDRMPPGAQFPLVKPRSIDDVPILALTLHGATSTPAELRRLAAQLAEELKRVPDVSEIQLIGGARRELRIELDPEQLAARGLSPLAIAGALAANNQWLTSGELTRDDTSVRLEAGSQLTTRDDAARLVVGGAEGRPVFLGDVAAVIDGPEQAEQSVWFGYGPAGGEAVAEAPVIAPAVTLTVAKRKGTNAVAVVHTVLEMVDSLRDDMLPSDVHVSVTRDYGETASEKSNELLLHMGIAVLSVSLLIWLVLGRREAVIVLLAIPATLALTLAVFYLYGYTLNRITLFALIFSIGILVDDAIVVVENIARHYRLPRNRDKSAMTIAVEAVDEVGNPTILATLAVIAAILPMAFVGGLMGPYMRPIPVGATAAMVFSLIVAFVVTPWATVRLMRREGAGHEPPSETASTRLYRRIMGTLLHKPRLRTAFLLGVVVLLVLSVSLFGLRWVEVKMLPFDNKSELQVIVNLPEGTPVERTAQVTRALAEAVREQPEVTDFQMYVGTAGPYNFNGLVRHYFLRRTAHQADIQVNFLGKDRRELQSHDIAKQLRSRLQPIATRLGARIQVAEVPPGPPVLQTMVAEVYGPDASQRRAVAAAVKAEMEAIDGIVDVDWYVEDPQPRYRLIVDQEKAALAGVASTDIASTLRLMTAGQQVGLLHDERAREDVPIVLRLPRADRADIERLRALQVATPSGLVGIGELTRLVEDTTEPYIYHKNLMPVVYVTADTAGAIESPVYAILALEPRVAEIPTADGRPIEQLTATLPRDSTRPAVKWDGEWHITYEVFRDLGLAFAAVLILIYLLVVAWFESFLTPLLIMSAIPFSLVGIIPAHGLLGAFFTATSMIGFIAGAGIVVRNSIILVDFIELRRAEGMPLDEAVIDAGAVRFRPMLLTAAAVVVGATVILFDPIFQGLAISLMAGEIASLLLSRMTVPVVYFLAGRRRPQEA